MLHIFEGTAGADARYITITGQEVNHIKNVLRMKPGEEICVSNGADGREYRYAIEEITDAQVRCSLRFFKEAGAELPVRVILFQGLPKSDKMDLIVQKAVELGAAEIYPVEMERCVVRLDGAKKKKRAQRWQTIAESAAQQSRRGILPLVHEPVTMAEAVKIAREAAQVRLIPYELQEDDGSTRGILEKMEAGQTAAVFIGPEGGFAPGEVELAKENGIRPISLGRRILRTETAAMVVLSWLIYRFEIT
ncbi:MAG: 16S rRNA (uracil(1498)-N(3))-methyltransferase [Lachnospiraceae bacterium]|nr:16S rRNA (uracil(1498)-N(3))-methyltransferase [Lachnospiraceae bacterium]